MAKRRITVTVDEELLGLVDLLGEDNLSATVNAALAARLDHLARREALRDLLDGWDAQFGPPSTRSIRAATRLFDALDGVDADQVA